MRALATSIHVRTHLPKLNKQMHYYDTYRGTIMWIFVTVVFFVLGQNFTPIRKYCLAKFYFPVFYSFKLCRRQAKRTLESIPPENSKLLQLPFRNYVNFGNYHALQTSRYNRRLESTSSKYSILAIFRLSRSAPIRVHVEVRNGHGKARGVAATPRRRRSNEAIGPRNSSFENPILRPRRKKLLTKSLPSKKKSHCRYRYKGSAWVGQGSTSTCSIQHSIG